jgi:hypothetical protein
MAAFETAFSARIGRIALSAIVAGCRHFAPVCITQTDDIGNFSAPRPGITRSVLLSAS